MPQPAPLFEIYVYAPDIEGIHLRGGRIARGGIRWSDRMDYRTEVFGLMRAQMTKNAVIVPTAPRAASTSAARPEDPAALRDEVERQYVTLHRGAARRHRQPRRRRGRAPRRRARARRRRHLPRRRRRQGHRDVLGHRQRDRRAAAASGWATRSPRAARRAMTTRRWASPRAARGSRSSATSASSALDPAVDAFTRSASATCRATSSATGCCCRDRIRLVAAYDHRHVFLDPDPDRGRWFAERKRLFELPAARRGTTTTARRSRRAAASGRAAPSASRCPSRRAPRWASTTRRSRRPTSSARSSARRSTCCGTAGSARSSRPRPRPTPTRSTARATRSASTPPSCAAASWARAATSASPSARGSSTPRERRAASTPTSSTTPPGVDCSDHEVNLKILLDLAVRRGELDAAGRDELLAEVTEDVVAHVLYDSFLQAQILAQEVRGSAGADVRLRGPDGRAGGRGPARRATIEVLPTSEEMAERRRAGRGLERPELAVLLAYAKRALTDALLESDLPDEPVPSSATCAPTSRRRSSSASATCSPSTRCAASWSRRSSPTTSSTRSARPSSRG